MWLHLVAVVVVMGALLCLWLMADENLDDLKGKRVIVTGASGGIGEQLAYVYAEHGATVVVTARRQAELNKVVNRCRELSPANAPHMAFVADMKDANSIRKLIDTSIDHMGGLDLLVLNHVTESNMVTFTGTPDNLGYIYHTMDINFRSYVQATALALPHLTESEGGLVVVNSLMGFIHNPKLAAYTAAKFALNGFFGSLRSQFLMEDRNIAVTNCVLGYIDTPNANNLLKKYGSSRVIQFVRPASAHGCAKAIAGASVRRQDVVYYPRLSTQPYIWLSRQWPFLAEFIMREVSRS